MSLTKRRYEMQKCNDGKNIVIWDNKTGECLGFTAQIKGRLNLQDDIINDQDAQIRRLNAFLTKKGLAEEFARWKDE